MFAFIDQFQTGGHFNGQIASNNERTNCNSVVVINLNKRTIDEKVLIHNISHESLHVAICDCLKVQCGNFVEEVIDNWLLGEAVYCDGWEGNLYILKAKKNERTHKELHGIK